MEDNVSIANPTFSDIVDLLNTLVPANDSNVNDAPHQAFWRGCTRDQFVSKSTDDWGVNGKLVVLGEPASSNLYLALSGTSPFDGSQLPQMPDTNADPNARAATMEQLGMVKQWILNNAPA
jgi:hypothetical protein